jgi:CheY-like chemotaxis protein
VRRPMAADVNWHAIPESAVDAVVLAANTDVRRIARFLLESSGVRVTTTDDGPVAARAMRRGVPQALITDRDVLRLPGIAKLSEIKRHHGALRVAVIDDPFPREAARPAGVDVVLSWPLARHQLLHCLPKGSAYWKVRR